MLRHDPVKDLSSFLFCGLDSLGRLGHTYVSLLQDRRPRLTGACNSSPYPFTRRIRKYAFPLPLYLTAFAICLVDRMQVFWYVRARASAPHEAAKGAWVVSERTSHSGG